jgi:dipeptidyl aminopeptidase/acylaminoacyl peptidase
MHSCPRILRRALISAACASLIAGPLRAQSARPAAATADSWLVLGPLAARGAAFSAANDSVLLASSRLSIDRGWPAAGTAVEWLDGRSASWTTRDAPNGSLQLAASPTSAITHAVVYLDADRFTRAKLSVVGPSAQQRTVSLDGVRVAGDSVTLRRGTHVLLVQILQPAGAPASLSVRLEPSAEGARVRTTLDPRHAATLEELMATAKIGDIAVDPTGRRAAWVVRHTDVANDQFTGAVEVHDLATGRLVAQLAGTDASAPRWSRDGTRLAYLTATDRKGATGRDLWIWSADRAQSERVLRGERGLSSVEWGAKGDWLYFTASTQLGGPESFKAGDAQHLTEVWDRWSFWPEKAQLYALDTKAGTRFKLVGDSLYSVEGARVSPDGRRIVFARSVRTATARPWLRAEVWLLDLADASTRKLLDLPHEAFGAPTQFAWSPDGNAVAFCASAGETLSAPDSTFSVYETELYATSVQRPALVHLSNGFVPAVRCNQEISWSAADQRIYFTADAGARTVPARTKAAVPSSLAQRPQLETLAMPGEDIASYAFGPTSMVAAIETPTSPAVVYKIPLGEGAPTVLDRPSEKAMASSVLMPSWKPWEFTNSKGSKIEAWYWLPPGFDSTKTYPMVVHYYGGTLPMKKGFDERLIWFASNGYVVFMLNPAGTPGYGQQFANLHIDDWGFPAASDIIEGVQQFERAHPYVDAKRVGNFGHSYGGFMTMHLATRTPIFATSISIAGISNIAAYWGAGWTGYSYTEGTCRGCYPWNRRDVFVDRSPLFQADKIRTPMLLITGTSDTNVPPGETEQMFTALRMLGRDAELVRIYGENHGINSRPSVTRTLHGTMLDWYDKQLRSEPDAWMARWRSTLTPVAAATADFTSPTER